MEIPINMLPSCFRICTDCQTTFIIRINEMLWDQNQTLSRSRSGSRSSCWGPSFPCHIIHNIKQKNRCKVHVVSLMSVIVFTVVGLGAAQSSRFVPDVSLTVFLHVTQQTWTWTHATAWPRSLWLIFQLKPGTRPHRGERWRCTPRCYQPEDLRWGG